MNSSKLYFFLPSITDRSETVNKYLSNISISPLDIKQEQLNCWADNVKFDPQKLDFFDVDRNMMTEVVVKCLKHVAPLSNSNLLRNADGLLCKKKADVNVE